jgi:hypothetical protein
MRRRKKLIIVLSTLVVLIGAATVWLYLGQLEDENRYVNFNIESRIDAYAKQEGHYPRDMASLVSALEHEGPESILARCGGAANSRSCTKTRKCIGSR